MSVTAYFRKYLGLLVGVLVAVIVGQTLYPSVARGQNDTPIPATRALNLGCWPLGLQDDRTFAAVDPEWVTIGGPVILEGRVATPAEIFGTTLRDARYVDSNGNNTWDPGEWVIQDKNLNNVYDAGEAAYASGIGPAPTPGTPLKVDRLIKATNVPFLVYDRNDDDVYDSGEPLIGGFGNLPTPGTPLNLENGNSQGPSEISELDTTWNHYTHDKTILVIPDSGFEYLLSGWKNPDGTSDHHRQIEVEWEASSNMVLSRGESGGSDRIWGVFPQFAWPSPDDRVWVEGQWIFDCGHPGRDAQGHKITDPALVKFESEIHPPRAVVTFRLNHPSGNNPTVSSPYRFEVPDLPINGLTQTSVTEADVFVSGNGGGAHDVCNLLFRNITTFLGANSCVHSGPVIPVNDRNYVFDIYPPGTDYTQENRELNGTFKVNVPTRDGTGTDVSLQWRVLDRATEVPAHAGSFLGSQGWTTTTVEPLLCPVDKDTPPPSQEETKCPMLHPPLIPTRLRVILPFKGSRADVFARTILLGWDDVPDDGCPATKVFRTATMPDPSRTACAPVRSFSVSLHELKIFENGEGCCIDGDWRVFVDVAGQWRYLGGTPCGIGQDPCDNAVPYDVRSQDNPTNVCQGDSLGENGEGDCFRFDDHPWTVRVQDGTPIHIAVGGFESDETDSSFCRDGVSIGCDPGATFTTKAACLLNELQPLPSGSCIDDKIGTLEFDLNPPSYSAPGTLQTGATAKEPPSTGYQVTFTAREVRTLLTPTSELAVGNPRYDANSKTYVTSATPLALKPQAVLGSGDSVSVQYRFRRKGFALPTFAMINPGLPAPNVEALVLVHWTNTDFSQGTPPAPIFFNGTDGEYVLQFSAQKANSGGGFIVTDTEPRHTTTLTLDNTPPIITVSQPAATQYPHSATIILGYSVSDGAGSGVSQVSALMDGASTLVGHGLPSGQPINLLTELALGTHTFTVHSADNLQNAGSSSVTFTIIVTPDSIKDDVRDFSASGAIRNHGLANSLLAKLSAASAARARGNCTAADSIYRAFINELQAQSGKGVDAAAATVMITDARFLIAHCP